MSTCQSCPVRFFEPKKSWMIVITCDHHDHPSRHLQFKTEKCCYQRSTPDDVWFSSQNISTALGVSHSHDSLTNQNSSWTSPGTIFRFQRPKGIVTDLQSSSVNGRVVPLGIAHGAQVETYSTPAIQKVLKVTMLNGIININQLFLWPFWQFSIVILT